MGRKRKPSLEIEYQLERENKDLKEQIAKLKKRLLEAEKRAITEVEESPKQKLKKLVEKACPTCGAELKETFQVHALRLIQQLALPFDLQ